MISDIAYRMAMLNPQLLDDVTNKTSGVVLIDELDLHLHPQWQQRIVKDLTTIFPKVQFIVTTHSPNVIGSVPHEQLLVLENYQIFN
jgi:predicted ATP-binding protein involved in virulence